MGKVKLWEELMWEELKSTLRREKAVSVGDPEYPGLSVALNIMDRVEKRYEEERRKANERMVDINI